MNDSNPYRSTRTGDNDDIDVKIAPNPDSRFASVVLIAFGLTFLTLTVLTPFIPENARLPFVGRNIFRSLSLQEYLVFVTMLLLQVYAGLRSWNYRIPVVGCIATFVMCVLLTDTEAAPIFSTACLGAVGILIYTGWFRRIEQVDQSEFGG